MDAWWIDAPRVRGSANPTNADLERLRDDGFEILVSLLDEEKQPPRYDVAGLTALGYTRYNIAVRDFGPPTVEQLERFVRLIGAAPPGAKIIVHCEGGSGRTGTFAAAYWVTQGMTVADAISHVRAARPRAIETPGQEDALRDFASGRRAR
jgi:protein-tyrosine phosphatase